MQGEFQMKKEEGTEKNSLMEAVQLELEIEKRKIRENIIASEIVQRRNELETEIRMKVLMEEKLMGMRGFSRDSSSYSAVVKPYMLMDSSRYLGYEGEPYFHKNLLNVGSLDAEFRERLKSMSYHHHPIDGVNDSLQISPEIHKNEVLDVALGKRPFERDLGLVAAAHNSGKSMAEFGGEEVLNQAMPSSSISGMKRKAETLAASAIDEETTTIANKNLQKKWYCSLCDVSATSAGGLNLHLHGKKHKAKEAMSKSGDTASSISADSFCAVNQMQTLILQSGEEKSQVQPMEEKKDQVETMEEKKDQVETMEKKKDQVETMEEKKDQVETMEEKKDQVETMEEKKDQVETMEEKKDQVETMEEKKDQVETMEEERSHATKKWECSLCQISATSETLLRSHLQGKKHKAKEARLGTCQRTSNKGSVKAEGEAASKWYCSLCQVSAASEKNLNDHFHGKKHKAKAGLLHQEADNEDSKSAEKVSEDVNMEGTEGVDEQEPSKGKASEQEMVTVNAEKQESIYTELVKFWHCKMCNEGTYDEATMAHHRESSKHKEMLQKIGGGLIVVSNMPKEAVEVEKVSQLATLDEYENENENENENSLDNENESWN